MPTPPSTPSPELQQRVLDWIRERTSAQVYTINRSGFPTGRTMGVNLNDDGSIDLIQAADNGRVHQARRDPHITIEWNDGGSPVPKVVFLQGLAEVYGGDRLVEAYRKRIAFMKQRLGRDIPERSEDEVRERMAGIHVRPVHYRVEGFGEGPEVFAWDV